MVGVIEFSTVLPVPVFWVFEKLDAESALESSVYAAEELDDTDDPDDEEPYIPLVCGLAVANTPPPSTWETLQAQSALLEDAAQYDSIQENAGELVDMGGFQSVPRPERSFLENST